MRKKYEMAKIDNGKGDKMKYIIMCGGDYNNFETPRQLSVINGEELVARTIRLLRENGVKDIAISSNNPIFEKFGIPVLKHDNKYIISKDNKVVDGQWFNAFYPTDEPACYIFGDVYFSPDAIKTIVETPTDDIELFGSKKPFASNYCKTHEEPFALKVVNQKHLRQSIERTRELDEQHKFWRKPIVWELFTVIKDAPLQTKRDQYTTDYVGISDYSVDVDRPDDVEKIEHYIKGGNDMIRVEVIEEFTYGNYDKIKDTIIRKGRAKDGWLYVGDVFECDEPTLKYLTGDNRLHKVVVKVIEVVKKEEPKAVITKVELSKDNEPSLKVSKKSKKKKK